ncbi:hypothetical protein K438DRAFT_1764516 [Mycena galopus ATCC 62051]|nr:hypothetical protein K438DRAFT_1764516 [Mycena galopus ATCC 62051]
MNQVMNKLGTINLFGKFRPGGSNKSGNGWAKVQPLLEQVDDSRNLNEGQSGGHRESTHVLCTTEHGGVSERRSAANQREHSPPAHARKRGCQRPSQCSRIEGALTSCARPKTGVSETVAVQPNRGSTHPLRTVENGGVRDRRSAAEQREHSPAAHGGTRGCQRPSQSSRTEGALTLCARWNTGVSATVAVQPNRGSTHILRTVEHGGVRDRRSAAKQREHSPAAHGGTRGCQRPSQCSQTEGALTRCARWNTGVSATVAVQPNRGSTHVLRTVEHGGVSDRRSAANQREHSRPAHGGTRGCQRTSQCSQTEGALTHCARWNTGVSATVAVQPNRGSTHILRTVEHGGVSEHRSAAKQREHSHTAHGGTRGCQRTSQCSQTEGALTHCARWNTGVSATVAVQPNRGSTHPLRTVEHRGVSDRCSAAKQREHSPTAHGGTQGCQRPLQCSQTEGALTSCAQWNTGVSATVGVQPNRGSTHVLRTVEHGGVSERRSAAKQREHSRPAHGGTRGCQRPSQCSQTEGALTSCARWNTGVSATVAVQPNRGSTHVLRTVEHGGVSDRRSAAKQREHSRPVHGGTRGCQRPSQCSQTEGALTFCARWNTGVSATVAVQPNRGSTHPLRTVEHRGVSDRRSAAKQREHSPAAHGGTRGCQRPSQCSQTEGALTSCARWNTGVSATVAVQPNRGSTHVLRTVEHGGVSDRRSAAKQREHSRPAHGGTRGCQRPSQCSQAEGALTHCARGNTGVSANVAVQPSRGSTHVLCMAEHGGVSGYKVA